MVCCDAIRGGIQSYIKHAMKRERRTVFARSAIEVDCAGDVTLAAESQNVQKRGLSRSGPAEQNRCLERKQRKVDVAQDCLRELQRVSS